MVINKDFYFCRCMASHNTWLSSLKEEDWSNLYAKTIFNIIQHELKLPIITENKRNVFFSECKN